MQMQFLGVLALSWVILPASLAATPTDEVIPPKDETGWQYQGEDSTGVKLWKKEIPGSPIVAFRGETIIEASIPRIAAVLGDSKRRTEWVADAKEARDLRADTPMDRVEYNRTGAPWPVSERDFVYRVTVKVNRAQKAMHVHIRSVEEPSMPPRPGIVRGELINSAYWLNAIDESHTLVRVEILADPKGDLPKWVVNMVQKDWPKNTLIRMGRQVAKADIQENPALRAYFDTGAIPSWAKEAAEKTELNKVDRSQAAAPLRSKGV